MHYREQKARQAPRHIQTPKIKPTVCKIPSQAHSQTQHTTQSKKGTKRTPTHQIQVCSRNTVLLCRWWLVPNKLYDTLDACFDIDRIQHCNPHNLRDQTYYSEDPLNNILLSEPLTDIAWTGTSMSLPEFHPNKLTTAMEQAIYSVHTTRNHTPSLTILILPDWKHTPYLARNLHTNYVQHIATIPKP